MSFPHTELFHSEKDERTELVRDADLSHLYKEESATGLDKIKIQQAAY